MMAMPRVPTLESLKLQDFCERVHVDEREVRYALARGIVPEGMTKRPGRGNHRLFSPKEAFWLAIVLRLKAAGIQTPLAGEIATWSERVRGLSINANWDWTFSPFDGYLVTENTWILEVGDHRLVRFRTDAYPGSEQPRPVSDWVAMSTRRTHKSANPIVIVQVNLSELARLLRGERGI